MVKAAVDCNALVWLDVVDPHPNQALQEAAAPQLPDGTQVSKHPLAAFSPPFALRANPQPASPPAGLLAGAKLPAQGQWVKDFFFLQVWAGATAQFSGASHLGYVSIAMLRTSLLLRSARGACRARYAHTQASGLADGQALSIQKMSINEWSDAFKKVPSVALCARKGYG